MHSDNSCYEPIRCLGGARGGLQRNRPITFPSFLSCSARLPGNIRTGPLQRSPLSALPSWTPSQPALGLPQRCRTSRVPREGAGGGPGRSRFRLPAPSSGVSRLAGGWELGPGRQLRPLPWSSGAPGHLPPAPWHLAFRGQGAGGGSLLNVEEYAMPEPDGIPARTGFRPSEGDRRAREWHKHCSQVVTGTGRNGAGRQWSLLGADCQRTPLKAGALSRDLENDKRPFYKDLGTTFQARGAE
ncbi:uncharacterized protein LOC121487097 [Vulpes lagopus]|uniref:uncharacterized protein LOC121487097 n=1 Tax=Vulpes lagopus TaxID=494514 RepID=UPI001BC9D8D5|nr:uncharacterized protein LOC121487097 [Vulpes lagopus]